AGNLSECFWKYCV
nr:urotensin II [Rana ridibunda=European green frogs, brain, Peptide, 13 aa] [Pelophylax ridibundus]